MIQVTDQQKKVADYDNGCCVVKACPGSGKTFSVALRILRLLKKKEFTKNGIAAMSFTNAAADEIRDKMKTLTDVPLYLSYPHYLGTIDKFINTYIFLPFGHLLMGCNRRPELVGKPHRSWTFGKGEKTYRFIPGGKRIIDTYNPDGFFDCVSFDINDELYKTSSAQEVPVSLDKDQYYLKAAKGKKEPKKKILELIHSKKRNYKAGYATQADANYLAWKILENYPLITKAIAEKFQYFIIDEAQDTDAIQMRIIELLNKAKATNIMLIGDRDQSIYEWNNADPALFDKKYEAWDKIDLYENWRSSQAICDFSRAFSSFEKTLAVSEVSKYDFRPTINGYDKNNTSTILPIFSTFFAACEENAIPFKQNKIAILYRGKGMGKHAGIVPATEDYQNSPWVSGHYYVKDIIHGKLLMEKGDFKKGFRSLEKAFFESLSKPHDPSYHCDSSIINGHIESKGFTVHREIIASFINTLPATSGLTINNWIDQANRKLTEDGYLIQLPIEKSNGNLLISSLQNLKTPALPSGCYVGTIHSAKGKTFDAVLLLIDKKAGAHSYYTNIFANGPKPEEEEELRAIYVAMTRPRKVLMLAVPNEDVNSWNKKLRG